MIAEPNLSANDRGRAPDENHTENPVIDLLNPGTHIGMGADETFARLRHSMPLHWTPATKLAAGFWSITRHEDVWSLLASECLSSERGNMLGTVLTAGDPAGGRMLVVTEGRMHELLRRVVSRGFAPRLLGALRVSIAAALEPQLDQYLDSGAELDFVADMAAPLPLLAICELMDVPAADREHVLRITRETVGEDSQGQPTRAGRIARNEVLLYYAKLARIRRDTPGTDVVSQLATCTVDGRPMSDIDVVLNCYNLIIGGDETTRLSIAGAAHAAALWPQEWTRVVNGEVDAARAVEEILRWTTPAAHVARTVIAPFEVHGTDLSVGEVVALWLSSANRDERAFHRADLFDAGRRPNQHLAFGRGHHFCVGAQLARLELETVVSVMRERVAAVELSDASQSISSNFLRGFSSLPVRLKR